MMKKRTSLLIPILFSVGLLLQPQNLPASSGNVRVEQINSALAENAPALEANLSIQTAVHEQMQSLKASSKDRKLEGLMSLNFIGPALLAKVHAQAALLESPMPELRRQAARELGRMSEESLGSISVLVSYGEDQDPTCRLQAHQLLQEIQRAATSSMGLLRQGLVDRDAGVRMESLRSFFRMTQAWRKTYGSFDEHDSRFGKNVLTEMAPSFATLLSPLIAGLSDSDSKLRLLSMKALNLASEILSFSMRLEIAALKGSAKTEEMSRQSAVDHLDRIAPSLVSAWPALSRVKKGIWLRRGTVRIMHRMAKIGIELFDAAKPIAQESKDQKVLRLLFLNQKALEMNVHFLITAARDPHPKVCDEAARGLKQLGSQLRKGMRFSGPEDANRPSHEVSSLISAR